MKTRSQYCRNCFYHRSCGHCVNANKKAQRGVPSGVWLKTPPNASCHYWEPRDSGPDWNFSKMKGVAS